MYMLMTAIVVVIIDSENRLRTVSLCSHRVRIFQRGEYVGLRLVETISCLSLPMTHLFVVVTEKDDVLKNICEDVRGAICLNMTRKSLINESVEYSIKVHDQRTRHL